MAVPQADGNGGAEPPLLYGFRVFLDREEIDFMLPEPVVLQDHETASLIVTVRDDVARVFAVLPGRGAEK